jgi:tetratricopeptide (TPR) repeat protein
LKSPIIVIATLLTCSVFGQVINDNNSNAFLSGTGIFSTRQALIDASKHFAVNDYTPSKDSDRISLRCGNILLSDNQKKLAISSFEKGVKRLGADKDVAFALFSNLAYLNEERGKVDEALAFFRKALGYDQGKQPKKRKYIQDWISFLEIRSSDKDVKTRSIEKTISEIHLQAEISPEAVGRVQEIFEKGDGSYDTVLLSRVTERMIRKPDEVSAKLLMIAFSSCKLFDGNYPSVKPFGLNVERLSDAIVDSGQGKYALMTKAAWSQALHDHDIKAASNFTSKVVKSLDVRGLSGAQREEAIHLVHELETLVSSRDEAGLKLVKGKLADLAAKPITRESPAIKDESKGSFIPIVISFLGAMLILIIVKVIFRKGPTT